jgi:predicted dehydrogenase
MIKDKVKWGSIGCGDVMEIKSGPPLQMVDNSDLVAVMRRSTDKAKDFAQRHHVPKYYDDADKLIEDEDVNAVYIATPPDTHAYYTIKALNYGKPVYVEKPMALNYNQCKEMLYTAEKMRLPLFVAFYRRSQPQFLKVKELLESKEIGDVRLINIHLHSPPKPGDKNQNNPPWRIVPEISGGGHFFDLAPHQLDLLDFLIGPVKKVNGLTSNQAKIYKPEDTVTASLEFEHGILAGGSWCFSVSANGIDDIIEIKGTKGKITCSCFEHANVYLKTEDEDIVYEYRKPKHAQWELIQSVVNDLLGKGKCPSTGKSAARTSWVMDEIIKNK